MFLENDYICFLSWSWSPSTWAFYLETVCHDHFSSPSFSPSLPFSSLTFITKSSILLYIIHPCYAHLHWLYIPQGQQILKAKRVKQVVTEWRRPVCNHQGVVGTVVNWKEYQWNLSNYVSAPARCCHVGRQLTFGQFLKARDLKNESCCCCCCC